MNDDLISRQAVIDIIHLFFTEEVDKIPTKKTEDGEVYIIRKCQPLFEMNKAICKRIRALPSASPTQNCVEKCVGNALDALDCISRQAVLEQTYLWSKDEFLRVTNPFDYLRKRINDISPVNPQEPKTGRWIPVSERLPEEDNFYLVTAKVGNELIINISEYTPKNDFWDIPHEIVAWLPLPKPYKAESEKKE